MSSIIKPKLYFDKDISKYQSIIFVFNDFFSDDLNPI